MVKYEEDLFESERKEKVRESVMLTLKSHQTSLDSP